MFEFKCVGVEILQNYSSIRLKRTSLGELQFYFSSYKESERNRIVDCHVIRRNVGHRKHVLLNSNSSNCLLLLCLVINRSGEGVTMSDWTID